MKPLNETESNLFSAALGTALTACARLIASSHDKTRGKQRRLVSRASALSLASLLTVLSVAPKCDAQEPLTLMKMIGVWRYPDSKVSGATLSDAATINAAGERTIQSIQYKAVFTTEDPMAKVIAYYKTSLVPKADVQDAKSEQDRAADSGRSITFHEDSDARPLNIQVILVNTDKASTTVVISRAATESETHIAWTRYQKLYKP